jgi:hypothetical protein
MNSNRKNAICSPGVTLQQQCNGDCRPPARALSSFVTAISGLWMSHFYPWPAHDGVPLYIMRLFVGGGMIIALLLATDAIRRRKFWQHRAWMIRAYALAMGAGTQVLSHIPVVVLQQELTLTNRAIAMGTGWLINILVAEWIIATRLCPTRRSRRGREANQPILVRNRI